MKINVDIELKNGKNLIDRAPNSVLNAFFVLTRNSKAAPIVGAKINIRRTVD
jgi:hypothetical protein